QAVDRRGKGEAARFPRPGHEAGGHPAADAPPNLCHRGAAGRAHARRYQPGEAGKARRETEDGQEAEGKAMNTSIFCHPDVTEKITAIGRTIEACGSRVTCDPPPQGSDYDYLVVANQDAVSELVSLLNEVGFK